MIFASFAVALFFATVAVLTARAGIKRIIVRFVARIEAKRVKARIARELVLAGDDARYSPDELLADSLIYFLLFFTGGFILSGPVLAILIGGAGTLVLFLSLRKRATSRQSAIERALPDMIEMVRFLVEAGISLRGAIVKVAQRCDFGPLSAEMSRVLSQLSAGLTLEESVVELSARSSLAEVGSFVTLVKNSSKLGVSVAANLELLSKKVRNLRYQRIERRGHQASQKLLVPIVFLIMPANFVIIFGPLLLNFMNLWR